MKEFDPERIYDLYFDTVYKVCFLYMKNHADAQDMMQETFCQMLRKPFRYETDEKAKAWLIRYQLQLRHAGTDRAGN